jgi:predicted ATPase/pimeloyl-ACP methyl ester carboxylesterase
MEQRIHFCTSPDGVRIAYAVVGEGPVLVKVANWLSHLEYDWNSPVWRHWLTELARSHTLVRYDKRGCGLSDWDVEDFSLGAQVEDLETVVNTLGLNRFPLFGLSGGGPIAVAYAVRHPEKVSHLILYGSYVRGRLRRSQSPAQLEEAQMLLKVMELGWGKANPAFRQVYTGLFVPEGTAEQVRWFNDLQRISTSPEIAVRIFNGSFSVDIGDLAPSVTVPTLVLHARDDALVPFEEGRQLATLIPGARFAPLEGKNHILLEHESAWPRFLDEVHQFLQAEPEAPPSPMSREVTPPSRRTPSMETEPTVRHNLPAQPTPFVGREQKLAEVRQLLAAEPACRLLTLVGPGGIGKTRLALAAASSVLSAFPGGVYFVPLASVGEAAHVVPAIVKAIGLNPSGPTPPKTQLLHHLRDAKQPLLLLLDNLEHVLEGADALAELLSAAPQLKVLATSRERLNLQEEWVFEVRGMASPPVGAPLANIADLEKYNAARLFLQRARQADARFHPSTEDVPAIARLCRLVDGIPLGLELAAPWVRSMTCREIADEIERNLDFLTTTVRNVPERHRSLRAVLEQTWERLTQEERDVLRQLSVFRGGCTREAAETVIGASVAALSSLMGRALLRRVRDGRYELHELIRQFAAEQLQPGDQEAAQERHSAYYTTLLEQRIADLKGGRQKEALDEIAADIDNVRAAWGCAVARRGASALERAAQALWLFCEYRGALSEGEEAFGYAASAFMTDDSGVADGLERPVGFLLAAWGSLCARRGEFAKGRGWMQQGIVLLRRAESPDRQKEAFALAWLGFICILHREYDAAQQHAQESLALYPQTGDSWTRAGCLRLLGAAALYQARLQEAEEYLRQCLAACREIGERRIRTYASLNLSQISQLRGEYARAGELLEEALTISQELGDRLSQAALLSELGRLATARGEYGRAIQLIQDSLAIQRQISQSDVSWSFSRLGAAYRVLGEDVEAEQAYQESLAAARAAGHQLNIALALSGLGRVAHDRAQYRQAEQFQRDALTLWQRMEHEPEIASVLRHLGHTLVALDAAREPEARQAFGQALRLTVKHGLAPVALDVFVGVAPLLAREDETQRAVELLSLARHHPASTHETKEKARHRLTELSGDDLHADLASRAVAQGLLLDWRGQASRLFEELSGSDSD